MDWKCLKCGAAMMPEVEEEFKRMAGGRKIRTVHVCHKCRTFHRVNDEGGLRLVTNAEYFEMLVKCPEAVRIAETAMVIPQAGPTATAIIGTK